MQESIDLLWYALAFIAGGLVAGFVSGLFGVGGGVFTVPLFLFLFDRFGISSDIVMHEAVGTSLALIGPSSWMAVRKQHSHGYLDIPYFKGWWPPLVVGVIVGVLILSLVSGFFLKVFFTIFLLLVAIYLGLPAQSLVLSQTAPRGGVKGLFAACIGCISVLVGTGGGTFTVPVMKAYSYPLHMTIGLSSASSALVGFVGALGAVITGLGVAGRPRFSLGYVDLLVFFILLPTVMLTAPWGAKAMHHLNPLHLRIYYALFLLCVALYMFLELTHLF
ncbi:MAG: sulfite exporter TauE/SafE family protein [Verrucomicrobia bacterium]|nr:sulfite exporter TauE/SafE family protein [Verrucomicrobiota bacterium]